MTIRRPSQKGLFDGPADQPDGQTVDVSYRPVGVSRSTFKGGLAERVHRWFRMTPSFGPALVRQMLTTMSARPGEAVFDPFAGAATTLIEARLQGFRSLGYEINPFLHFVGHTCLDWGLEPAVLRDGLQEIRERFLSLDKEHGDAGPEHLPFHLPTIHNITRWWRPDVLRHLVFLRESIDGITGRSRINFFRLALAGVLVPDLTNVTLGRLQLFFIDRAHDRIDVWSTFESHAAAMIDDIGHLRRLDASPPATLIHGDSVKLDPPAGNEEFDLVITSPPYPNRYSYVWNTRPHLYMLDFFTGAKEAATLDKSTIGGTWGTATSVLSKGILPPYNAAVAEIVGPVAEEIRQVDNLMANYCLKYFNNMAEHFASIRPHLSASARLAYVVGCSRLKKVYVETDVLLGRILDGVGLGYKCCRVERFRKRNSGKDLHESIVYAEID